MRLVVVTFLAGFYGTLLTWAFVIVAALFLDRATPTWPPILFFLILETVFLYPGLLIGIWVGVGGPLSPWRFVGLVVFVTVTIITSQSARDYAISSVLLMPALAAGVFSLAARTTGVSLEHVCQATWPGMLPAFLGRHTDLSITAALASRPQWSLATMFSWTLAVAIVFSCVATIRGFGWDMAMIFPSTTLGVTLLSGGFLPWAGAVLWAALGERRPVARGVAIVLLIVPFVFLCPLASPEPIARWQDALLAGLLACLVSMCWLWVVFWFFRRAGYRLVWRGSVVL